MVLHRRRLVRDYNKFKRSLHDAQFDKQSKISSISVSAFGKACAASSCRDGHSSIARSRRIKVPLGLWSSIQRRKMRERYWFMLYLNELMVMDSTGVELCVLTVTRLEEMLTSTLKP